MPDWWCIKQLGKLQYFDSTVATQVHIWVYLNFIFVCINRLLSWQFELLNANCSLKANTSAFSSKKKWMSFCQRLLSVVEQNEMCTVCRFAVNLRYQQQGGDIAFHFNPRVNDRVVVRNSNLGGSWGPEERDQPSFPFQAGQPFAMIIFCEPNEFKVSSKTSVLNKAYIHFNSAWVRLQASEIEWI